MLIAEMQGSSVTFISKGGSEEICGNDRVEDQSFFTETDAEYIGDQLAHVNAWTTGIQSPTAFDLDFSLFQKVEISRVCIAVIERPF